MQVLGISMWILRVLVTLPMVVPLVYFLMWGCRAGWYLYTSNPQSHRWTIWAVGWPRYYTTHDALWTALDSCILSLHTRGANGNLCLKFGTKEVIRTVRHTIGREGIFTLGDIPGVYILLALDWIGMHLMF